MPRMSVNLRPSTIQFNDGQDPIVNGIANFGATMAKLPVQLAEIRMKQHDAEEDQRRWEAMHQLSMGHQELERQRLQQEGDIARDKLGVAANKPGPGVKHMTGVVLHDVNSQIEDEALRQGFGSPGDNGKFKVTDPEGYQHLRTQGFIRSDYNPDNYLPLGPDNPYHVPMPKMAHTEAPVPAEQAHQIPTMQQIAPESQSGFGSFLAAMPHEPAPQQQDPMEEEADHHAGTIAKMYLSGDTANAQDWIDQMRREMGEEFTNHVKERVRTLVQAQSNAR